jgi:hypothetical protein
MAGLAARFVFANLRLETRSQSRSDTRASSDSREECDRRALVLMRPNHAAEFVRAGVVLRASNEFEGDRTRWLPLLAIACWRQVLRVVHDGHVAAFEGEYCS